MTRRKALAIVFAVIGVSGLIFVSLALSKPVAAVSHASYKWKPGCHCGKPTATTAKPTATTAKKPTATTAKPKATTAKPVTTTATTTKKPSTTTSSAAPKTAAAKTTSKSTKGTKSSTTSTSAGAKAKTRAKTKAAVGAALAAGFGSGDGGSGKGTGGSGGGGTSGADGGTIDISEAAGADGITDANAIDAGPTGPPRYYLSPVAIAFLLVYGASFVLYRTKRLKVATHRKVWNVLLLATFLMCGLIGMVLVVGLTRGTPWEPPAWLLVWHVETGIVMCLISFFHIGWHLRYYLAIVTGKRKAVRSDRPNHQPVAEKHPAGRPRSARPKVGEPATRSRAERMLAFERRQAARAEAKQPSLGYPLAD
jgi:hypothetical protein